MFALGEVEAPPTADVERHVAACKACLVASRGFAETLASLAGDPSVGPGGHLRARLDRSVRRLEQFTPHAMEVAALLDIDRRAARQALFEFHDGNFRQVMPGVFFRRAPVGASLDGAFAVLARLEPGATLPRHQHLGDEATLVLQGGLTDHVASAAPGQLLRAAAGSAHEVIATGDEVCCCVVVVRGGVTWG